MESNFDARLEALRVNIESLHANAEEAWTTIHATQKISRENTENIAKLTESITALARIAAIHERRLTDLEGGENVQ